MKKEKPIIGIMPKVVREELRLDALSDAIARYKLANKVIPKEWLEEYYEIKIK